MSAHRHRQPHLPSLLLLLTACAESPPSDPAPEPVVRDSAGIHIVENTIPRWRDGAGWQLSERPTVQLGAGIDGDPNQQFTTLRAVRRLADGTLMVADAGTLALLWFAPDGTLLRRSGGRGQGPGELGDGLMTDVLSCAGDTTLVSGRGRITVFDPSGVFDRTVNFPSPTGLYGVPRFCLGDRLVAVGRGNDWRPEPGIYRDSLTLLLHDRDGNPISVIDTLPVEDRTYVRSAEGVGYHATAFGRMLAMAARGELIASGMGDDFEVDFRDLTGRIVCIVRVLEAPGPVTSTDVQRYREFVIDGFRGNPQERRAIEAELNGSDLPATLPAFAELQFDEAGNLWARRYDHVDGIRFYNFAALPGSRVTRTRVTPDTPRTWSVLDSAGAWLGDVATPPGFIVHQIGDTWILGVWRDELDVEHVQLYEIIK